MSSLRQVPDLPRLVAKYGLQCFVETGCDKGDGLRHAQELGFGWRYSCDLNPNVIDLCRQWGDVQFEKSTEFLRRMFPFVPTLYWLDAHFPDVFIGGEWSPDDKWPLRYELEIIKAKPNTAQSVIICDDMQAIQSDDNPVRAHVTGQDDWCEVTGSIKELTDLFAKTHRATLHHIDTGILVMEPR